MTLAEWKNDFKGFVKSISISRDDYKEIMEYIDDVPESQWIPVTKRLPAMGKSVLMCDIDGDIYLGHRTQCGYYYPDFCGDRVKNVTAWQSLPSPYKGEKNDNI